MTDSKKLAKPFLSKAKLVPKNDISLAEHPVLSISIKTWNVAKDTGIDLASRSSLFKVAYYCAVPVLAALVTWMTGFLGNSYENGLPLSWKFGGCPGPMDQVLGRVCFGISYNWIAFALGGLFYTAVWYGLIFGYARYRTAKPADLV